MVESSWRLGRRTSLSPDFPNTIVLEESSATLDQARALVNDLVLSQQMSLRTMNIALGVFSMLLAGIMVSRILRDGWRARKLTVLLRPAKLQILRAVHAAELFPLVLGAAMIIQQTTFIGIEGSAISTVTVRNCDAYAQITLPAIFLVSYTSLVFGIETTVRALKGPENAPRTRWNTPICLGVIFILLIITWIPTVVWQSPGQCYGSLIWFAFSYRKFVLPVLSILIFSFVSLGTLISLRLLRSARFEHHERIAASRMVYYLVFATIEHTLILPFFVQAYMRNYDTKFTTSSVAEVSLFGSGVAVAFMHLFLRVNVDRTVIKPRGVPWHSRKNPLRFFGFFGPSDLEMNISEPLDNDTPRYMPDKAGFYGCPYNPYSEKPGTNGQEPVSQTSGLQAQNSKSWPLPPEPIILPNNRTSSKESMDYSRTTPSYTLFPTQADDIPRLPAAVYTPPSPGYRGSGALGTRNRVTQSSVAPSVTDVREAFEGLQPPRAPFARRHRRGSSTSSSATVQIGLRLSLAPAAIAARSRSPLNRALAPPPLRLEATGSNKNSVGPLTQRPSTPASAAVRSPFRSPAPTESTLEEAVEEDLRPMFTMITRENSRRYLQNTDDGKVLPPAPLEIDKTSKNGSPKPDNATSRERPAGKRWAALGDGTINRSNSRINRSNSKKAPESKWI
ncbi:uncharacterized protein K452DRAFT_263738 [Aplosporella prunicola CBS 121167]|uniref:Uncharacterized protein n=1 Tax=Aplosporella prunicola CBS 121167 TaxID=1176127 RepID=A0A6A6BTI0_9PEZI|nr:uncharacterized protein K452DRAFT_263738 [Aplosporella prunicola CBS 121167]KAF2146137.1 hypothetical protein K452DRAFT_263738 [Aplosporella prunicola CBS 121167]